MGEKSVVAEGFACWRGVAKRDFEGKCVPKLARPVRPCLRLLGQFDPPPLFRIPPPRSRAPPPRGLGTRPAHRALDGGGRASHYSVMTEMTEASVISGAREKF